jgi:quercetin dioxygenase-like cupin family protein
VGIKKTSRKDVKVLSLPGRDAWILISKDSLGAKTVSFIEVHIKPGEYTNPPHAHTDFEEVIYVKDGLAEIWLEADFARIEKGEAVLIPINAKHAVKNIGSSTLKLLTVFPFPDRTKGHVDYEDCRIPEWEKTDNDIRD